MTAYQNQAIPAVQCYTANAGVYSLLPQSKIVYAGQCTPAMDCVLRFMGNLFAAKGWGSLPVCTGQESQPGDIIIRQSAPAQAGADKDQAYEIDISDRVQITAQAAPGVQYALTTVLQLLIAGNGALQQGKIVDFPDVRYRIVHLDNGRKYFGVGWIEALLREMSMLKYNQLELDLTNDEGFRFRLDDMTVDGVDYGFLIGGNEKLEGYENDDFLTQSDMDKIFETANACGVEIVPGMNTPGHMRQILERMRVNTGKDYRWKDPEGVSETALAFADEAAVSFIHGLLAKYAAYFAGKGCRFFDIGADEVANELHKSEGIGYLYHNGFYGTFIAYMNQTAALVKRYGMSPRMWNDGCYYENDVDTEAYQLDKDIACQYWSGGWEGYVTADPSTLANKGMKLVNVYRDCYYIVGKNESTTVEKCLRFSNNVFHKLTNGETETVPNDYGSCFAIWCDQPNFEDAKTIAAGIYLCMRAMASKMWNGGDTRSLEAFTADVERLGLVPGGFTPEGALAE